MTGAHTFTTTESGTVPRGMKRQASAVNREVAHVMGVHWHSNFRKKHFTVAGATEYGYTPRQGERGRTYTKGFALSYTGKKLRYKGHTRPLVWSGDSERLAAIQDVRTVARKGVARARVIIHARGLNRRYTGSPINMRAEITTVSQREADELRKVARDETERRYKAIRDSRRSKIS